MSNNKPFSLARSFSGGPLHKVPKPGDVDFIGPVVLKIDPDLLNKVGYSDPKVPTIFDYPRLKAPWER
jgi:hypothetical protein